VGKNVVVAGWLCSCRSWVQTFLETEDKTIMALRWLSALRNRAASTITTVKGDRRTRQRIERYFECNWVSEWSEEQARVSSISPNGCFVESRFTVPSQGTHVREIRIALPDGEVIVHGIVVDGTPGVGFAVRFADMDDETRTRLAGLATLR
jgi:hypothetical protein